MHGQQNVRKRSVFLCSSPYTSGWIASNCICCIIMAIHSEIRIFHEQIKNVVPCQRKRCFRKNVANLNIENIDRSRPGCSGGLCPSVPLYTILLKPSDSRNV